MKAGYLVYKAIVKRGWDLIIVKKGKIRTVEVKVNSRASENTQNVGRNQYEADYLFMVTWDSYIVRDNVAMTEKVFSRHSD